MQEVLHLNLKKQWFDLIASGQKKEEYRAYNAYWKRRCFGKKPIGQYKKICFSNGYSKDRRQMVVHVRDFYIGPGNEDWGAEKGIRYFIFSLGPILSKNF